MSINLNSICRTCLSESGTYYKLFDYAEENCKIWEMLDCVVPQINIKCASKFSTLVCQMCVEKLLIGYKFQQLCIISNKRLRDLLGNEEIEKDQKIEIVADPLKETELVLKHEIEEDIHIETVLKDAMKSDQWLSNSWSAIASSARQPFLDELKVEDGAIEVESRGHNDLMELRKFQCLYCPKHFEKKTSLSAHCKVHKTKEMIDNKSKNLVSECHDALVPIEKTIVVTNKEPQAVDGITDDKLGIMSRTKETDGFNYGNNGFANVEQCNISTITYEFECEVCGKIFDRSNNLRRHNSSVHSLARPYECEICTYRFSDAKLLKAHLFQHKSEGGENITQPLPEGYKCEVCQRNFMSMKQLAKHSKNQHPAADKHKCDYCSRKFILHTSLLKHISNRHKSDKRLPCQICKKVYGTTYRLRQHMRIHKSYLCPHCGKTFHGASNIREHMERHKGLQKYQCPDCPKRFNCKSDVTQHASAHSNAKPHVCDICGSRFTRKYSMHKHKSVHMTERPYKCDQCSMTFKLICVLKRHMRTHTGEKPYKCTYCERAYSESGDLTKHLRTHVGENTYTCDQCPMAFKYKVELRQHQYQHYKMDQKLPQTTIGNSEEILHEKTKQLETCGFVKKKLAPV